MSGHLFIAATSRTPAIYARLIPCKSLIGLVSAAIHRGVIPGNNLILGILSDNFQDSNDRFKRPEESRKPLILLADTSAQTVRGQHCPDGIVSDGCKPLNLRELTCPDTTVRPLSARAGGHFRLSLREPVSAAPSGREKEKNPSRKSLGDGTHSRRLVGNFPGRTAGAVPKARA